MTSICNCYRMVIELNVKIMDVNTRQVTKGLWTEKVNNAGRCAQILGPFMLFQLEGIDSF